MTVILYLFYVLVYMVLKAWVVSESPGNLVKNKQFYLTSRNLESVFSLSAQIPTQVEQPLFHNSNAYTDVDIKVLFCFFLITELRCVQVEVQTKKHEG